MITWQHRKAAGAGLTRDRAGNPCFRLLDNMLGAIFHTLLPFHYTLHNEYKVYLIMW